MGDSKLVVKKVRKQYVYRYKRLLSYRHQVWDLIEGFDAFNIEHVPKKFNKRADALVVAASTLEPLETSKLRKFIVEMVPMPSIPDNVTNLQLFEDDHHIKDFITNSRIFKAQIIDEVDPQEEGLEEGPKCSKRNNIPKGTIELERLFDIDQVLKQRDLPKMGGDKCEPYNLGTPKDIKK